MSNDEDERAHCARVALEHTSICGLAGYYSAHDGPSLADVIMRERAAAAAKERERRANSEDLFEKSMNIIHERAGVRRDGLCAILAWIDNVKEERERADGLERRVEELESAKRTRCQEIHDADQAALNKAHDERDAAMTMLAGARKLGDEARARVAELEARGGPHIGNHVCPCSADSVSRQDLRAALRPLLESRLISETQPKVYGLSRGELLDRIDHVRKVVETLVSELKLEPPAPEKRPRCTCGAPPDPGFPDVPCRAH